MTRNASDASRTQPAGADRAPLDVTIVLPTYNEEASVGLCVTEALETCAAAGLSAEVVVVDNNCTDDSAAVAVRAGARVVTEVVPGYGAAIRRGIDVALGTVVVMADADCTYPLDRLAELVNPVLAGEVDIAIGGRLDAATRESMPMLHRFVGTPTLSYLVRESNGGGRTAEHVDSQSGFRAFRRDTVLSMGLRATGMEFASEMLIAAVRDELVIVQIPLGYRPRVGESKLNTWTDGWRHVRLILSMSPHLLLWQPGLLLTGLAILLSGLSVIDPGGMEIGSLTWQPVFFSTTLLVLGVTASLAGAVLAHHSPQASGRLRRAFSWVADPSFTRWTLRVGVGLGLFGVSLDGGLMVVWLHHSTLPLQQRLALAGLAQAFLLTGLLLCAFALLYRLLTAAARAERAAAIATVAVSMVATAATEQSIEQALAG